MKALEEKIQDMPMVLLFEENLGQHRSDARFVTYDHQAAYLFFPGEVVTSVRNKERDQQFSYRLRFLDANPAARLSGKGRATDPRIGKLNAFTPAGKLLADVPKYEELHYSGLWQGVDVHYHNSPQGLKYDFIVQPGSDPSCVQLSMDGVSGLAVTPEGELSFSTPFGELRKGKPYCYQVKDGRQVEVAGAYTLKDGTISFSVGKYDPALPLVIDPVALKWSTYLGGETLELYAKSFTASNSGDKIYIAGEMDDFLPIYNFIGETIPSQANNEQAYVMCVAGDGSAVLWTTVFYCRDGTSDTEIVSVSVDEDGKVYAIYTGGSINTSRNGELLGYEPQVPGFDTVGTRSLPTVNFPQTALFKLSADGSDLEYMTYLYPSFFNEPGEAANMLPADDKDEYTDIVTHGNGVISFAMQFRKDNFNDLGSYVTPDRIPPTPGAVNTLDTIKPDGVERFLNITGIVKLNTTLPGAASLLAAGYLGEFEVGALALHGDDLYLSGRTTRPIGQKPEWYDTDFWDVKPLDYADTYSLDPFRSIRSEYLIKMDASNLERKEAVLFHQDPMGKYGFNCYSLARRSSLGTDSAGNLYRFVNYLNVPEPYNLEAFFKGQMGELRILEPSNTNTDWVAITKYPAGDLQHPEWTTLLQTNTSFYQMDADAAGRLHLLVQRTVAQPPLLTQGAFLTETKNFSNSDDYVQYLRLSPSSTLEYGTVVAPFNSDYDKTYLAALPNGDAYVVLRPHGTFSKGYPVTPSYRNEDSNTQVNVTRQESLPLTEGLYGIALLAFHEPKMPNEITDFPANSEFCPGALIHQGGNDGPITGASPVFVAGDGSDSTHNLPIILETSPRPHPIPKSPAFRFQWQKSYDNANWSDIPEGDKEVLKPSPEMQPGPVYYRRLIIGSQTSVSNVISTMIDDGAFGLTINGPSEPVFFCPGTSHDLGISISGATGNISWQWYNGFTPLTNGKISPASGSGAAADFSASIGSSATADGYYRLVVTDANGCKKEFFVTTQALTEKIYKLPEVSICPGDMLELTLGPKTANPLFDYQYTSANGFSSNSFNPVVSQAGTYQLQVKLKTQANFCAGGQTELVINAPTPHDAAFSGIPGSLALCETAQATSIGVSGTQPAGYSYDWLPKVGLNNYSIANPNFNPYPRPNNGLPVDEITYLFSAVRILDGCIFEKSITVTDTAAARADAGMDKSLNACVPGSVQLGGANVAGTHFIWEVAETTYPGGLSALQSQADFGLDAIGTTTGTDNDLTFFFPPAAAPYTVKLVQKAGYFPLNTVQCFSTDTVLVHLGCPGSGSNNSNVPGTFTCSPLTQSAPGTDGACSVGRNSWIRDISSIPYTSINWSVLKVDGVAQPAGVAPRGLFHAGGGTTPQAGAPINTLTGHTKEVYVVLDDPAWGFPAGTDSVEYQFTGTYVEFGVLKFCQQTVTVYTSQIPDFAMKDLLSCLASYPATLHPSSPSLPNTYTIQPSDYA
ncbi:MAG: cell wall surface anchor family protein, partial [Bacteroidota bacterium]